MKKKQIRFKNVLITIGIFLLALVSSLIFERLDVREHITTVFAFAVFMISLSTDGYVYGVISAVVGTLVINYAFTYPFYALDFITPVNLVSAVIMTTIAVLTGTLTTKLKTYEAMKAESEKERMQANLLRAVSHDLRTPLTTIYSASSALLENEKNLTEEQQKMILKSIREDSDWLMRMVENLLSITRIDRGRIKIIKTPTVLDELIDSVMAKFIKRYPNQEVSLELPEEIVVVPMDAILIEQVLVNILENAVLHAKGMKNLSLRVFTRGEQAVFEIADDGCGISEERRKYIFTSYFEPRDEGADSRKRNMGIGLSVCATIIKAHDGSISAENKKNGGAVFRFALDKEETISDEQ